MRPNLRLLWTLIVLAMPSCAYAQQVPCKSTVTGHLDIVPLTSAIYQNTRSLRIWLPPGYDDPANAQKKYPVLYLYDGDSAFDACTAYMHDELHADETLTGLITSGKIPPVIAVAIDNASDILGHTPIGDNIDKGTARAREYIPYPDPLFPNITNVLGDRQPDFLEHEVMPFIAARYRILPGPSHATLWGDSYAGAAALYIAIRRPSLFGSVIIESPSLQIGNGQLLRDSKSLAVLPSRIAIGIGTDEVGPDMVPNPATINAVWVQLTRQLAENLKAADYIPPQLQLTVAPGAHHATGDFGKRLAAALLFIYRQD